MSEPKKLWTGAWMGIPAHVEMIGDSPVPFLAGRRAQFERDVLGILSAAVVGLAAELGEMRSKRQDVIDGMTRAITAEGEANRACYDARAEVDLLRDRLDKLEAALSYAVTQLEAANELLLEENVRGEEDGVQDIRDWIHEIRAGLLKDGGHDGKTSKG